MVFHIARIIFILIAAFGFSRTVFAQRSKTHRPKNTFRILKHKPTVYITFEQFGQREPLRLNESNEGVWLRLHNNSRWSLILEAHGTNGVFATGKEEEVGMFYGVEEVPRSLKAVSSDYDNPPDPRESSRMSNAETKAFVAAHKYDICEVPVSYSCHVCSTIELPPGKSLLFSLPRETLCGNLKSYVSFKYKWEDEDVAGEEPEHRVYFYGSQLPKVREK